MNTRLRRRRPATEASTAGLLPAHERTRMAGRKAAAGTAFPTLASVRWD